MIIAYCSLKLLGLSDSPISASREARSGVPPRLPNFFMLSHFAAQAGLELLSLNDPPALASQIAGIASMSQHALLVCVMFLTNML